MSDRMIIMGKDGRPKYMVEDGEVIAGPHKHKFNRSGKCVVCRRTREEINKESE
jgi:hypothetical protein